MRKNSLSHQCHTNVTGFVTEFVTGFSPTATRGTEIRPKYVTNFLY